MTVTGRRSISDKKTLEQLYAEHSGKVSDKWSSYLTEYGRIFEEYRDRPVRLLEIGIQNGGSLEIWSKFFPHAQRLVGCDIDAACAELVYEDPRIAVVVGDANSDEVQQAISGHASAFDIILDDGSHRSGDIVRSFARYFRCLVDGGVYAVEDLHCSYWQEFQGGLHHPFSSVSFFKRLADAVNHEHWGIGKSRADILRGFFLEYGFEIAEEVLQTVHSVQFTNSLCIVRKDSLERNKLNARVVAGSVEPVRPGLLELHSSFRRSFDQTSNPWTVDSMPPDEVLARLVTERDKKIASLHQAVAERDGRIAALYSSPSWRITAPFRALPLRVRWFARNTRRALMVAWWLATGQFSQAIRALLPYYQRFVPLRVKTMFKKVRELVKRWLTANGVSLLASTDPTLNKAIAEAEAAMRAEDWPKALTRWEALLDGLGDKSALAAHAKLNISVARRLSRIDAFKEQIDEYAKAQARRSSRPREGDRRIAIYTAISGGYDSIRLPEMLDPQFDYVLFTDTPAPDTRVWQVRPTTYFHKDQTRTARFVKTHPHMLLAHYDIAIWIDSNIMILDDIYPLVEGFLASGKAVAAVPHPLRRSVYEEVETCIQLNKDEPTLMREQVARYRQTGFDGSDLIESNLMMFNLGNERVRPFLDFWWTEIDRYSKRDQLSLPYALKQSGIEWHRLTEHPNSARNHPMFAFVPHDSGGGPANLLINKIQDSVVDPYAGPPYADIREKRIAAQKDRRIDIVVCVHNALEDVKSCLESVRGARGSGYQRVIIVDDGSDEPTARYLKDFTSSVSWAELYRNEQAQGYTKAANQGLAGSTSELVILLNSDTIVTEGWAEKLADAVFSTPGAGIVGPISNAASHQSIPDHLSTKNQTAVNALPLGMTAEDMNRCCEEWTTTGVLPRVPLVHGFCFGVTRDVIDRIGFFDEDNFPNGYGEENDYCFRATDAGFSLVIATHTFVYHAKSKSYLGPERVALMKAGSEALKRLHGRARIDRAVRSMQANPIFVDLRQRARNLTKRATLSPRHIALKETGKARLSQ